MSSRKFTQTLIEPGIIRLEVLENSYLEKEDVVLMRQMNIQLSGGKRFSVLLNASKGYFTTGPEAMKLLASKEYLELRKATAIVVKSLAARLAGNFFKKITPPLCPTRLFNSEVEAIKWLYKF